MMTEKKAALHRLEDYSPNQIAALLSRTEDDLSPYMAQVAPVIEQVRKGGDAALVALAEKFDNANTVSYTHLTLPTIVGV